MPKGKLAGALVGFFILATGVGAWAAYSYSNAVVLLNAATIEPPSVPVLQSSNSEAKEDRLTVAAMAGVTREAAPAPMSYSVAALNSAATELSRPHAEPRTFDRRAAARIVGPGERSPG